MRTARSSVLHRPTATLGAAVLALALAAAPAAAQVDWSGGNRPAHGSVQQAGAPVTFWYSVYDGGRTEAAGRGAGLGAALFYRDAGQGGAFTPVAMAYAGQSGIGDHDDLFTAVVPYAALPARVEYFSVVYDSLAVPVHADTTVQDANGAPPNFVFSFGEALMPHRVYVHFSVCTNGAAAGIVSVQIDPRNGAAPFQVGLVQVQPAQLPDLWEGDVLLEAGVAQRIGYSYWAGGQQEPAAGGGGATHDLLMTVGSFLQGQGTDSWGGGPLGCHLEELLAEPVKVHLSVCLAGVPYAGDVCASGNVPELGEFVQGAPMQQLQAGSDLFEGDVVFPAGSPAVVQYKFRMSDCTEWENLYQGAHETTNRFLYIGGSEATFIAPTSVWGNRGANTCVPPLGVEAATWTRVKGIFR
jgi:hypothetical protein